MTNELEAIAAELSPHQVELFLSDLVGHEKSPLFAAALILRGWADYRAKWFLFGRARLVLTRKGRAIRQHLKENSNGSD